MKRKILLSPLLIIVLIVLLGVGVAGAAILISGGGNTENVNLQKGLVGWWKFDGNAKDSTPNQKNGTVTAATLTTDRKGQVNKAYSFNGTSAHISTGNVGSGLKAISFWMQANDTTTRKIIDIDGTDLVELDGSSNITATSFPGTTTIYVDGVVVSNIPDTGWHFVAIIDTTGVNASAMDIGTVSTSYFDGKLDDVRIYNRALSSAEITALYQSYDPSVQISDLQKGLVGNWKFDGNAKDSTPYANNGTVTGATLTTDRKGQVNKAYSFDGNDYVNVGVGAGSLNQLGNTFTMEAWIKTPTPNSRMTIFSTGYSGTGPMFGTSANTPGGLEIYYPGVYVAYTVGGLLSADTWYHVVYTRSGTGAGTHKFYINGVSQTLASDGAQNFSDTNVDKYIGYRSGYLFNGLIDEVRIYNRALSQAEITASYESYNPGIVMSDLQKGLVGHWKMDGNAKDSTPNSNHGTLYGSGGANNLPQLTTDRKGQGNKAYSFDGSDDYVNMGTPASLNLGTGDFTMEVWVKNSRPLTLTSNWYIFLDKFDLGAGEPYWMFMLRGGGQNGYRGLTFRTRENGITQDTYPDIDKGALLSDGNWHHIVARRISNIVYLYIDGVVVNSGTTVTNTLTNTQNFSISDNSYVFGGLIDEVRIYNRALSQAEITALYESY